MPEGDDNKDKTPPAPAKVSSMVERLVSRHGSAEAALAIVSSQLIAYEDKATADATEIADLRKKVPADGTVVLSPDQRKQWDAFQTLKLTPEQVAEIAKERDTLKGTLSDRDREALARQAATAAGFDPDALVDLARTKGLHIEIRDGTVKENGKDVAKKIPHVRPAADEKAPLVTLTEYAGKLAQHEQRMLKPTGATQQQTGTPWPTQNPSPPGGTATGDKVGEFIAQRNTSAAAKPSPFAPPRQPAAATT